MSDKGEKKLTLRTQAFNTMEKMEKKIGEEKFALDSLHNSISEIIEMINNISKSIPEILEILEPVENALKESETASQLNKAIKDLHNCLKITVEGLNARITLLESEVRDLQSKVENLTKALEFSKQDLARLKLRHILRRPESLIVKHFRPEIDLTKGEHPVKNLLVMNKFKENSTKMQELKEFCDSVSFDLSKFPIIIKLVVDKCSLHTPAHPTKEVEAEVTNDVAFEQLLNQCQIEEMDKELCREIFPSYIKLLQIAQQQ